MESALCGPFVGLGPKGRETMKPNFWTVTTVLVVGITLWLVGSWKYQCGWLYCAWANANIQLGRKAASVVPDANGLKLSVQGEVGMFEEPNQPLEVVGSLPEEDILSSFGMVDPKWTDVPTSDIVIHLDNGAKSIKLNLRGKLDIIGDPNLYTEAARVFLTCALWDAAYRIISEDPNAIRRLCESGRVCEVTGHQWGMDIERMSQLNLKPPGWEGRKCHLCGKVEQRQLTEWVTGREP